MDAIWDKLLKVDVKNKEKYSKIFSEVVSKIKKSEYDFKEVEREDYFIINEDRLNSFFIHIVPKEIIDVFREMQEKIGEGFLGFSVLVGKHKGKDVRVSCFGVSCGLLGKSLIK